MQNYSKDLLPRWNNLGYAGRLESLSWHMSPLNQPAKQRIEADSTLISQEADPMLISLGQTRLLEQHQASEAARRDSHSLLQAVMGGMAAAQGQDSFGRSLLTRHRSHMQIDALDTR